MGNFQFTSMEDQKTRRQIDTISYQKNALTEFIENKIR